MLNLERFENNFAVQLDIKGTGETVMELFLGLKDLHEGALEDSFILKGLLKISDDTLVGEDFVTLDGRVVEEEVELEVFVNGILVESLEEELNF